MTPDASSPLHRRLAAALGRIQVVTAAACRRAADAANLSPLQMSILQVLDRDPGQRSGELARRLEVTPGTVSVAVSALASKGLVRRAQDPEEHRAVRIDLTAKGRRTAGRLDEWADERLVPLVKELGDESAGQVLAALLTMLRAAEEQGMVEATRMCLFCEYFRPWAGRKDARPHRCDLLRKDIAAKDLRVDCGDFVSADPATRAGRGSILTPPS